MLSRLSIQNYAIIEALEIDFSAHLNILTGETGAGKSIIVGALGLILGERADTAALLDRERKCVIEGVFNNSNSLKGITEFLQEHELDVHEEMVLRREIAPNGKSRAFVNDTPVNLSQLQRIASLLVDLHQQFDTLELGESDFQREVLDALAGNLLLLENYQRAYAELQAAQRKLHQLTETKKQFEKELDFHQFQFNELAEAAFNESELEKLEAELKLLSNAEEVKSALLKSYFIFEESEDPVNRQVKQAVNYLKPYTTMHPRLPELIARLEAAYVELQDVAGDLESIHESIDYDAASIEQINERISLGYRLLKKHGVKSTNELLAIKEELAQKLQSVLDIDDNIQLAEKSAKQLFESTQEMATIISEKRKETIKSFEQKVNAMLHQVGMPASHLKVQLTPTTLNAYGIDVVEFLFDANKKNQLQPLRKVASGGELSRLMLCIKSLVAESINLPTLIFDEIDSGISGEAAKQVGVIMKDLCKQRQVICITHQPQIAGKADAHFFVHKAVKDNSISTQVKQLSTDERIVAIAKMLSGEKPTAAALDNAREMVMN